MLSAPISETKPKAEGWAAAPMLPRGAGLQPRIAIGAGNQAMLRRFSIAPSNAEEEEADDVGELGVEGEGARAGAPPDHLGSTLPHREATELLDCIRIMGEENAQYCRQEVLGEAPPPAPEVCDPNRPLTWADFRGRPPRQSGTGAATSFRHDLVTENGRQVIRAFFRPSLSGVRPQFADPTNRAVNGCAPEIARCERQFNRLRPNQTRTYHLGATRGCPASISPNTSLTATSRTECGSLLGPECDRTAVLESERLLRHEQLHFDIACVLARKGTAALARQPAQAQRLLAAVRRASSRLSSSRGLYDSQTRHGCIAGAQSSWEADVQNGLPNVTIP